MVSGISRILLIIVAIYCGYALLCFIFQRYLLYPGRGFASSSAIPATYNNIEKLWLETRFGRNEAWFLPAKGAHPGRHPAVLFFHGNGEIIDSLPGELEGFRKLGIAVLLVEYPGYGRSPGSPSEASITAAAVSAYDWLISRTDIDRNRIIAFGRSLGGGPVCALSRQRQLAALILQSPFTSTRPFARRYLLPGFLLRDVYDNRAALNVYNGPVLIMHGLHDDIVPVSHGKELARVARHASFVPLPCAHNDCPPDISEFWRLVGEFLQTNRLVSSK